MKTFALNSQKTTLYLSTMILAACSIIYELTIAQALNLLAANTVICYSLVVGFFILGLALGSFLTNYLPQKRLVSTLFTTEALLALASIIAVPLIHFGHMLSNYLFLHSLGFETWPLFGTAFFLTLLIGILTGIEMPLLMKIAESKWGDSESHKILATDYFGSLLGSLIFPLILIPHLEPITICIILPVINIATIFWLKLKLRDASTTKSAMDYTRNIALTICLALATCGLIYLNTINQYFLQKYYYYIEYSDSLKNLFSFKFKYPRVFRESSAYQKIDLVKDPEAGISYKLFETYSTKVISQPNFPKRQFLCLNGDYQFNSNYEELYHEYFAHVPIISTKKIPKNVLVLGGGDGLLIRELIKYPEIESIKHIDLDPVLIELSKKNSILTELNQSSESDPRVSTSIQDGYHYAMTTPDKYDAIYVDFPVAVDYNLSKLYSQEFFHFLKRLLNPDSFIVFDATGIGLLTYPNAEYQQTIASNNDWPIYYNTLKAAGFKYITPYITTLEEDNPDTYKLLSRVFSQVDVSPQELNLIQTASDEQQRQQLLQQIVHLKYQSNVFEFISSLQQGFIMMSNNDIFDTSSSYFPDIPLYVLNPKRLALAFKADFPTSNEIETNNVNSIFRPRFPTTPFWQPRQPY